MSRETPAYGLWSLVLINSAVFILFAFSFFKPRTKRDWRSFGAFSAFLVALFAEMYGFPLTIYFLSGWLQRRYPDIDWFSHDAGHLLEMMFGWKANPHFGPFHLLSFVLIGGGFVLIAAAWRCSMTRSRRYARDDRALQLRPASAICRLHPGDARLPAAVADAADAGDVSGTGQDVRQAGATARSDEVSPSSARPTPNMPPRCPDLFQGLDGSCPASHRRVSPWLAAMELDRRSWTPSSIVLVMAGVTSLAPDCISFSSAARRCCPMTSGTWRCRRRNSMS